VVTLNSTKQLGVFAVPLEINFLKIYSSIFCPTFRRMMLMPGEDVVEPMCSRQDSPPIGEGGNMPSDVELISLSELIEQIKQDLLATPAADPTSPLFMVDGVEITAQVVVKRERAEGGKAGLKLSVLGFGADAGVDTKTTVGAQLTQTLSIKLSPLLNKTDYLESLSREEQDRLRAGMAQALVRGARDDPAGPIS
jgi:hypothetical protein